MALPSEFQRNILELFLGRLWSVELCFYQAAGSFNKIFMAGKVLFMEIRLLKCLLGWGVPRQSAFLLTASLLPYRTLLPFPPPQAPSSQESSSSTCPNIERDLAVR